MATKKTVKKTPKTGMKSRRVAAKVVAAEEQRSAETAAPAVEVKKFFDQAPELKDTPMSAPAVYREICGSHTTILVGIGRTRCYHIPMNAAGMSVVREDIRVFAEEWQRVDYGAQKAAASYLKASQRSFIDLHPRAKAALESIKDGKAEADIKRAMDHHVDPNTILKSELTTAARAAGKSEPAKKKGKGIGAWVCEQLLSKVSFDKILKEVTIKFPGAKTNKAHLNWYTNKMKREGTMT